MRTIHSSADCTPALSIHLANFAATAPAAGWHHLIDRAKAADEAGVDRLSVSDHVVFGEDLEAYGRAETGGMAGGKQPTGPDGQWLEPLTVLSVIAGATERVRLQTGVLLAALRRPVVLAKAAATLDVMSDGRLDLGVGVGWQREEYEAAGLSYAGRGALLDHTLEVLQTLWRDLPARFESERLSFEKIYCVPQPVDPGGVPLWISGTLNDKVIKRVARFGVGWIPWGDDMFDLPSKIARLRDGLAAEGRDASGLQIPGNLPAVKTADGALDLGATMAGVPALVEAGVTDFRLNGAIPVERSAAVDMLSPIVAAFRSAVGRT